MSEIQPTTGTSRRNLMRAAALTGMIGGLTATATRKAATAVENNSIFPNHFWYPPLTGPSLALWGSSSFEGSRATEGVPAGFDARVSTLLGQYLSLPVLNFGRGGETSTTISARRGVAKYQYAPVLPNDVLPAKGSVTVALETGNKISWETPTYVPGFIQDIPVVLKAIENQKGSYSLTRMVDGDDRYCPTGFGANYISSYQDAISKSSFHVLQIGRNNIGQTDQIQADTVECFDKSPQRSIVLGHFRSRGDAIDSDRVESVIAYNSWAKATYGNLFIDPEEWLRSRSQESWLRYGDLAGSDVWNSANDQKDYENGSLPRSLYASDGLHLNGWGYIVLARAIEAKVRELGWV